MEAMELEEIERQISKIVKADLYERFPSGFIFDPIKVYPRTDHTGEDYLKVFIIYDGKMEDLDAAQTVGLITRIKPKVRALNHQRLPLRRVCGKIRMGKPERGTTPVNPARLMSIATQLALSSGDTPER